MTGKTYKASWARIGNSSGYRLPSEFFKENPEFVGADGMVQVIAPNTVIFSRTQSEGEDRDEDALVLSLFLDFLMKQALVHPSELEAYTQTMVEEDEHLTAGVILDGD